MQLCRELLQAGRWAEVLRLAEAASPAGSNRLCILDRHACSRCSLTCSTLLSCTDRPAVVLPVLSCADRLLTGQFDTMTSAPARVVAHIRLPRRRNLGLDLLRAAARGGAGAGALKRCLALAPAEQSMYHVLLHHCRYTGDLRVRCSSTCCVLDPNPPSQQASAKDYVYTVNVCVLSLIVCLSADVAHATRAQLHSLRRLSSCRAACIGVCWCPIMQDRDIDRIMEALAGRAAG